MQTHYHLILHFSDGCSAMEQSQFAELTEARREAKQRLDEDQSITAVVISDAGNAVVERIERGA
jgi:hypothetical protein